MMNDDNLQNRRSDSETENSIQIVVPVQVSLLMAIDSAAGLMEISREEMIQKILTRWEREQTLPLHGEDKLCNLKPGSGIF